MATKILNLEELASKEARVLRINGVDHPVLEMSVQDFIETTLAAERLEGETSIVKQLEATFDLVIRAVPSVDKAVLKRMTLDQLQAMTAFIRGGDPEEIIRRLTQEASPDKETNSGN